MDGPLPIAIGYAWRERIQLEASGEPLAVFPDGCSLRAHVKVKPEDVAPLAELTTGAGTITRVDDSTIDIEIPAASTATFAPGHVHIDFVRTDSDPQEYHYLRMRLDVIRPITRPA